MPQSLITYWPIFLALLTLAVAWGGAAVKIAELRRRVEGLEQVVYTQMRETLTAIREDIRELKTLIRGAGGERR